MDAEMHRQLATRWFDEVWNRRNAETIDALFSEEGVGHFEGGGPAGREAFKEAHATMIAAFPDLEVEVVDTLACGNDVVVRWRMRGTHEGDAMGFPASGEVVEATGMTWLRFEDGRIVEGWDSWNQGAMLQQILPAAP